MDSENYNHFTISYIEAILRNLDIRILNGSVQFFPDTTSVSDFDKLKLDLDKIWEKSESAIDILKDKIDAVIQNGLFGLVDDFELALRTGYLLGDRVVMLDYVYERILYKRKIKSSEILRIGDLCKNLVLALDLAKSGRFVIIPNPFSWNKKSKKLINRVFKTSNANAQTITLLNMLSIANKCNLNPYTIAESDKEYQRIVNDDAELIFKQNLSEAGNIYDKLLSSLLTEKILKSAEFDLDTRISLTKFASIIESEKGFYQDYLSTITKGGKSDAEYNIKNIIEDVNDYLKSSKKVKAVNGIKKIGKLSTTTAAVVTIIGGIATLNPALMTIGSSLGLVSPFTDWFNDISINKTATISVF
ncbi:hypothetical protein [Lacinutrix salivirga]